MDDENLYQKIAAEIRQEILEGKLSPGDRLPAIRQITEQWNCSIGTAQHAYQELARKGLVVSRPGRGTHVSQAPQAPQESSQQMALRRAMLVHRSESFLLEMVSNGYAPAEVDAALHQAMERWQIVAQQPAPPDPNALRFVGSHDPVLAWLASRFPEIIPPYSLQLGFSGSLGGLIALTEGKADLAGCHLWDEERDMYNEPFVRRILPGEQVALLTLAHRRLGLMTIPGNPLSIHELTDLVHSELRFANRQPGSGTRVWLDAALRHAGINAEKITGYESEYLTHFAVAAAVATGEANVGFGLQSAAQTYGLDFTFVVRERYDLVIPTANLELASIEKLANWLGSSEACQVIADFGGYDTEETGKLYWIN